MLYGIAHRGKIGGSVRRPAIITALQVHELLHRQTGTFPPHAADIDQLWNSATVAWLAAGLLQRYAALNAQHMDPMQAVRFDLHLGAVEGEMHWLRFCGGDAEQAATLLRTRIPADIDTRMVAVGVEA